MNYHTAERRKISFGSILRRSCRWHGERYRQVRQPAADCMRHFAHECKIDHRPGRNLFRPEDRPVKMRTALSRRVLVDEKLYGIAQPACQPGRRDRSPEDAEP